MWRTFGNRIAWFVFFTEPHDAVIESAQLLAERVDLLLLFEHDRIERFVVVLQVRHEHFQLVEAIGWGVTG
jgi:hypothetical protein